MTRKKKSRSLKRIHSVKTGNVSKLKRAGTTDRQNSNLKDKSKPKSVYQKFLEENPDAIEKQTQVASKQKDNVTSTQVKEGKKDNKMSDHDTKKSVSNNEQPDKVRSKDSQEKRTEKEPDLLSQLDNKNFNDFY